MNGLIGPLTGFFVTLLMCGCVFLGIYTVDSWIDRRQRKVNFRN